MDLDSALTVFWQFAVEDTDKEAYISRAFLSQAAHELHLFPSTERLQEFCRASPLPHDNEVRFDCFMELYRQLYKEAEETDRTVTRAHTHEMLAALGPPGTTVVTRQDIKAMLASSSLPLSTTDTEAVLDMLDPARTGVVELARLTQILQADRHYHRHHPHPRRSRTSRVAHTDGAVPLSSSSRRLPLRAASASPSPPRSRRWTRSSHRRHTPDRGSMPRPSTGTEVEAAPAQPRPSRRRTFPQPHSAQGRWIDEDVVAVSGAHSHTRAATATASAHTDHPHARVRPAPPQREQRPASSTPGAASDRSRRTFSDGSDGVSVLIDAHSTVTPGRSAGVRGGAVEEVHDPFHEPLPSPQRSPRASPRPRSEFAPHHTPPSLSSPRTNSVTSAEPAPVRAAEKQRGDSCRCCAMW